MIGVAALALFFVGLAIAGLGGWVADSRHVAYGLAWSVAPEAMLHQTPSAQCLR
jgi:hypothetical protein